MQTTCTAPERRGESLVVAAAIMAAPPLSPTPIRRSAATHDVYRPSAGRPLIRTTRAVYTINAAA
jgi:hypothetical protein